jgi:hypothetical protein
MTKLNNSQCQHHILSPKPMQSCQTFNQNLVLLFVFSFSYFALSSSRAISFVFKYLSAILFVLGKSLPRTQALWFVYVIKRTWDGTYMIDQINPRGPRKGRASHRTTHSAWAGN